MASPQTESQTFSAAIKQLAAEKFFWLATEHNARHAGIASTEVPLTPELGTDAQQFIRDGSRGRIAGEVYEMLQDEGGIPRAAELTAALVEAYPEFSRLVHTAGFSPAKSRELRNEYKQDVLHFVAPHLELHVERSMEEFVQLPLDRENVGPRSTGVVRQSPQGIESLGQTFGPRSSGAQR